MKKLKILVKLPTRSRPRQFMNVMNKCFLFSEDKSNIEYLISYDLNDATMTKGVLLLTSYPNVKMYAGISRNKIHACNRDIERVKEWDIVLLLSDDMVCQQQGWDEVLRKEFGKNLDQCIHHNDGYLGNRLQTMVIFGRKYFDRFGYLYHPDYISLWADNHQMEVAKKLKKYKYFDQVLFKHHHYTNDPTVPKDKQYQFTESFYLRDKLTYEKHKSNNFGF